MSAPGRTRVCLGFPPSFPLWLLRTREAKRTKTTPKCLTSVSNLALPSPLGYHIFHLGVYVCQFPGSAGSCLCPASAPCCVVPSKQGPAHQARPAALQALRAGSSLVPPCTACPSPARPGKRYFHTSRSGRGETGWRPQLSLP